MAVILPYPDQPFVDGTQRQASVSRCQRTRQQTYRKFSQVQLQLELQERKIIKTIGFISGLLLMSVASSAFATTVKQEPPMEAMREDQVLLVDDGSCPTGQIKRVVGGNHTKVGGTKQVVRTISCVPS